MELFLAIYLEKTLGKLLSIINLGRTLGNKIGITLHNIIEIALCAALEIELESKRRRKLLMS